MLEGYGGVNVTVTYPDNAKAVVRHRGKSKKSLRTFIIPQAMKEILAPLAKEHGFVCHGSDLSQPMSYSTMARTYRAAYKALGIKGEFDNHDIRTTYGTQLKEDGVSSAIVADLMGHADTRMVETVYARTRHEGIMKQRSKIEELNSAYARTANEA